MSRGKHKSWAGNKAIRCKPPFHEDRYVREGRCRLCNKNVRPLFHPSMKWPRWYSRENKDQR